jgi:putative endonuclease
MFFVYAIKSIRRNYIYVGLSNDVERRIFEHNKGYNKTTKPYRPFKKLFMKVFDTRAEARKFEKYLKSGCGKELMRNISLGGGIGRRAGLKIQ